ncbi:ABC transporter substrate-binding protein [Anaerorhabdus sp.]|uniref:ABC transporter substrate-binding protein n=1 Tax=Anaerorhabdus sp. TaxID=1872524 RepID=UPI002FCA8B85
MRKIIFLTLVLVLTLSACTNKSSIELGADAKNNQLHIEENLLESECPFYKKAAIDLPSEENFVKLAVKSDTIMYYCATDKTGTNLFYKYDITDNLCMQLNIDIPGNIHSIDASNNCLYILVKPNNNEGNNSYEFKEFNIVTQDIRSILLDKAIREKDGLEIASFSVVGDKFYVNAFDSIYCFDGAGELTAEIKTENTWRGLLRSVNDDSLKMYNYIRNSFAVQEMNFELQPTRKYVLSTKYNEVFQGFSHNQMFVTDETNIYSLDLETGDKKPYASIPLYNLHTSNFIPLSNESFFTIENGVPTFWVASSEEDRNQITILKCATYNASFELQLAVSLFNFDHIDTKIDIVDYSVYNDGMTKLMVEISAGNIPDIFDLTGIPITAHNSAVLLENLEDHLSKSNIVPNILEILKKDEGIFEFTPGFQIVAMAGSSKDIKAPSMNVDVLLELAEKARSEGKNLFPKYITREMFISLILSFSGDSFFDIEKDYCNFEDEKLANLIQFALELPSDDEFDDQIYTEAVIEEFSSVLDGKQLVSIVETGNPVFELLKLKGLYRDKVEFVGFPSDSGNGIAMTPFLRVAMSSTSHHKDEIWTFFDYLLSEEFQTEMSTINYMPVVSEHLSMYINSIIAGYRDEPLKLAVDDTILECPFVDDETANDVWEIISRVDCIDEYDTNIYKIVLEECQPFFAGQKDISEIMPIIQSRASIYISEKQ